MKRLIIGISGASGVIYGIRLLEVLREVEDVETHLVMTNAGAVTIGLETDYTPGDVTRLADVVYSVKEYSGGYIFRLVSHRWHDCSPLFDENAGRNCLLF
jgi:3-polyprenyl-4-hydroxybenzoate decarboxylase